MPKKYHKICAECGEPYYGQGKYFCSNKCQSAYNKGRKLNITEEERRRRVDSMRIRRTHMKMSNETK